MENKHNSVRQNKQIHTNKIIQYNDCSSDFIWKQITDNKEKDRSNIRAAVIGFVRKIKVHQSREIINWEDDKLDLLEKSIVSSIKIKN